MTHKNWDNVRDHRIYGYLNQHEMDTFLTAMQIRKHSQPATAVREFIMEHSEIIINRHSKDKHSQIKTVKYQFPDSKFTVDW